MDIVRLIPIMFPAFIVVAGALAIARRERADRDDVIDRTEVPIVRIGDGDPRVRSASLVPAAGIGGLVVPEGALSLGARLQSVTVEIARPRDDRHARGRVIVGRRRTHPLVASR